ncbi:MAG: hypothetical protein ABSF91_15515 [Bacteroidota bacterium]|jgi:hypothetical protein
MNDVNFCRLRSFAILISVLFLLFSAISCQYDYNSPGPGYIEVRLRTIAHPIDIFNPQNNFTLTITQVEAERNDGALDLIYGDLKAFNRTPSVVNTLDTLSRDSVKIMGLGYAPPGHYVAVDLLITPGQIITLDAYRQISVCTDVTCGSPYVFNPFLRFEKPFDVNEGRTTRVTLTINLDSTLVRGAEKFYFRPYYYISSILYE